MKPKKSENTKAAIDAQYKIREVRDVKFLFSSGKSQVNEDEVRLSLYFIPKIEVENKILIIRLGIKITVDNKDTVEYVNETAFEIKNFKDVVLDFNADQGTFSAVEDFMVEFSGIALSIARGILVEKLSGTALSHIIFPLVPKDIIRNNILKGDDSKQA